MTVILPEELAEINTLRTKLSLSATEVGQCTLQIKLLQEDVKELENKILEQSVVFKELLTEEQKLVNRLSEKYGAGSLNFETGEFTPEK